MSNNEEYITIEWRIHFKSKPEKVFDFLNTKKGREKFWSESANEKEGKIEYLFPGRQTWTGTILERIPNKKFVVEYYDGSITSFELTTRDRIAFTRSKCFKKVGKRCVSWLGFSPHGYERSSRFRNRSSQSQS